MMRNINNKHTPQLMKLRNRELIINELKINPEQSRADLSQATHLSKPTVSGIVKELINEGLIFENGIGQSTGGKKPVKLVYNANYKYVVSILIENEFVYFALGDMNGEIVRIFQRKFKAYTAPENVINTIEKGVIHLLKIERIDFERVLGIVVGVSGIKTANENYIRSSPTIEWGDVDLKKELQTKFTKEVIIENDVDLMTIGEYYKGEGKKVKNFIYIFIGNGIGSGLFLNGEFYKGFHSASGEIGYMMIGNEENAERDLGVFETNYGLLGVTERLKDQNVEVENFDFDGTYLLNMLQNNKSDKRIELVLTDTINQWAKAAINIISVIDPETVILSGELVQMDQASFQQFKRCIDRYVPQKPEIKMTKLGYKAGIYGAFNLALSYFHVTGFEYDKT